MNTFTAIFPGYLILLKRVGTERTRDDSLLLLADAPTRGGALCLRRPLDSLILPAEVWKDQSSLGTSSLGPRDWQSRDWQSGSHCLQEGDPRKKRTSTAHIVQRMWWTPGPSECISTVAPVLDKPPVRMDESARAAKELEEEVCRREIDEANLAASRERQDRRTAAQRQRRATAAADKKMRQRRQQ